MSGSGRRKHMKRAFIIVMDSMGIGAMPDAGLWNDEGSNTLGSIRDLPEFDCPNLSRLGLFDIDGVGGGTGGDCRLQRATRAA